MYGNRLSMRRLVGGELIAVAAIIMLPIIVKEVSGPYAVTHAVMTQPLIDAETRDK